TRSLLYSVLRDAPADRGGATQQIPLTGLSGALCHPRHLARPGAPAAARSAR
ncbi:hypothetical protein M9458_035481, partial [Cirrhinus mrigala]